MKFVHAADIHLDSPLHGLSRYSDAPLEQLRGATRRALENLVQLCLDEEVDLLLIAGDLYDGEWRDVQTALFLNRQLARLLDAGIQVHLVLGNHDADSALSRGLRWPEGVHQHSHKRCESVRHAALGVVVHGQSYAQREVLDNLTSGYPQAEPGLINLGLLHTNLNDSGQHAAYAPSHPESLNAKGYHYWALGHVHQHKVVQQRPPIVYSGNLQGRHARECGAKGALLVEVDLDGVSRLDFHPLDVVRWHHLHLDLSHCERRDAFDRALRTALDQALAEADGRPLALRLTLHGRTPLHRELHREQQQAESQIQLDLAAYYGEQVWLEQLRMETTPPRAEQPQREGDDPTATLLQALDHLKTQPARLLDGECGTLLHELAQKLPPILQKHAESGMDGAAEGAGQAFSQLLTDPAWLAQQLDAVEQELLTRLDSATEGEDAP